MTGKMNLGKTSIRCRNPMRYYEMKDIKNLWLWHKAEFLPEFGITK